MRTLVAILLTAVLLLPVTAPATIWYVPDNFGSIQAGIDGIPEGDTLVVREDTYYENLDFNGHNIVLASLFLLDGDPAHVENTVIDGSRSGTVITFSSGEDSTTQVVGFTIQNGYAADGGGVYCESSHPTIANNTVSKNSAVNYGGGIYCLESDVTITDNTISGNSAGPRGGGVHCEGVSNITITNNTISGNTAMELPNLGHGAGISCKDGPVVTISENDISGNYAYVAGGGIWSNCSTTIVKNAITGNIAEKNNGGGIVCFYAFEILNNTITRNSVADLGTGGGIFSSRVTPIVTNTIVYGNYAPAGQQDEVAGTFAITYSDIKGGWPGTGNIDADPGFAGWYDQDFHLRWHSPCIHAGDPDPQYNDPDGTRNDMGAFYFNTGVLGIVEVYPHDEPIVIPPEGGEIAYNGGIWNLARGSLTVDIYAYVFVPGWSARYRLWRFRDVTIPPHDSMVRFDLVEQVPDIAPAGDYVFVTYIGDYPSTIIDSCYFYFAKEEDGHVSGGGHNWQTLKSWFDDELLTTESALPTEHALSQNYPNPFNASTAIEYQLPVESHVELEVYNTLGRKVVTLVEERQEAGYKSVTWDASSVSSGVYFYKLTVGDFTETKRMMLVK
jgi:predicted outer membrane repeat protein